MAMREILQCFIQDGPDGVQAVLTAPASKGCDRHVRSGRGHTLDGAIGAAMGRPNMRFATAIDERDAEIAAHLGEVLWARGKREEAEKIWRAARQYAPVEGWRSVFIYTSRSAPIAVPTVTLRSW